MRSATYFFIFMKRRLKRLGYFLLVIFILINAVCIWQAFTVSHFSQGTTAKKSHSDLLEQKFNRIFGQKHPRQALVDSLTIPHQSLYITADSLKLAAWYLKHGADSAVKGTVIMFHGYGGCRSEIIPEATAFYTMQYNVLMIDFRAHGNSEGNICSLGYFESDDVRESYNYIKRTGEKNIILWGGSMGAASIIKAMHDDSDIQPSKVILEKSYGDMTDAVEGYISKTLHEPGEPLATMLTFWGCVEEGAWMFEMKPEVYAKKISCPALIQWGSLDETVSKQETENIYNNLGSSQKKLVIYPGCHHESLLLKDTFLWKTSVSSFLDSSAVPQGPINKKKHHNSSKATAAPSVSSIPGNQSS